MNDIIFHPIGVINTPYKSSDNIPIQGRFDDSTEGCCVLYDKYSGGLLHLDKFSHAILIYYFHKSEKEEKIPKEVNVVREYIEALLIAVVLALFIRAFVVQAFKIPSGSMEPTLLVGDHLLVNKFIYGIKNPFTGNPIIDFKSPERGDIIVFKYPKNPKIDFIKRVVAVAGDTVYMIKKQLYVNHLPVIEDYTVFQGDPEE
ncbi:MAG: signal peptidase I, partial [Draconibacterium sp.]|nr:signal peptidase I [Draconibacterium sp.]